MSKTSGLIAARHASVEVRAGAWTMFDDSPFRALHNPTDEAVVVRVLDCQRLRAWDREAVYRILPGAHVHIVGRGVILHEGKGPVTLTAQWPA